MAVRFDNSLISRVQQSNDIVDVVSEHLSLTKKGKEMVGLCPFHADHRPSMYVNPTKQIFKCFACGAGGDVLKFVQLRENLTFAEAVERLAARVGIKIKPQKPKTSAKTGLDSKVSARDLVRLNDWAMKLFQKNLAEKQSGKNAREYLKKRQITEESTKKFCLGFAPDSWQAIVEAALKSSVPKELLVAAGLVVQDENGRLYDKFRNRLMFPIVDASNRVIGFGGRTLGDDPAKYMNSPASVLFDKSNCLYGLDRARHEIVATGTAVVVEGYTDVIMAHQYGCKNVVAALGTSFTEGHAQLLRRYAKEVVLVFDNDVAGTEAANRALEVCLAQKIDIKITFVTDGKDPCDFLISKGKQAFEQIITNAVDVMDYKWQRLKASLNDKPTIVEKRAATEEFLRSVATAFRSGRFDPIAEGLLINRLSSIIGMSTGQIRQQIIRLERRIEYSDNINVPDSKVVSFEMPEGLFAGAQREILEVLLNEPSLCDKAAGKITSDQFDVPVFSEIAKAVFDLMARQGSFELAQLMTSLESTEAAALAVQLADDGEKKANFQKRIDHALEVFLNHLELQQRNRIKADLKDDDTESLRKITEMLNRTKKVNKRTPGIIA